MVECEESCLNRKKVLAVGGLHAVTPLQLQEGEGGVGQPGGGGGGGVPNGKLSDPCSIFTDPDLDPGLYCYINLKGCLLI